MITKQTLITATSNKEFDQIHAEYNTTNLCPNTSSIQIGSCPEIEIDYIPLLYIHTNVSIC